MLRQPSFTKKSSGLPCFLVNRLSSKVLGDAAGVVVFNFVAGGIHVAQTAPLHLHSLPVTFGLSAFVYSGHAVFPSIYRSMKDRSQYPKMLDTTYFIVGVTGALIGTVLTALSVFCLHIAWALFKHRLSACPGCICIPRKLSVYKSCTGSWGGHMCSDPPVTCNRLFARVW